MKDPVHGGKVKLVLQPASTVECRSVGLRGQYGVRPIGRVCKDADGRWSYAYVGPSPHTLLGPLRTKAAAIRAVVRGYLSWIG